VPTYVAIDLGASSGRVVNAHVEPDSIALDPVRRFPTTTIPGPGGALAWDIDALMNEMRAGLIDAVQRAPARSVAVDSWGVDYGLLDTAGDVLGPVHAYRSSRTDGVMDAVIAELGRERIYGVTGIQFLPINTVYQLVSARDTSEYLAADRLLMVPDLVNHLLCGSSTNDVTNASTTQLLDVSTRSWSRGLLAALGLREEVMPALHEPGAALGDVRGVDSTVDGLPVVAAASHDTASAVAGTPLSTDRHEVYISCGTWALVGCELRAPITSRAALAANGTNELGVEGSVRLLKNGTGLWLLEECRRRWAADGLNRTAAELVAEAETVPGGRSVIDPDDARFATPGDMPARIVDFCRETDQPPPDRPAEVVRTVLDSLALAWRSMVDAVDRVSGRQSETIRLVGGGAAIPLLRGLCASACGRPVLAGPLEATVVGNAVVQAIADGVLPDVPSARRLVERTLVIDQVKPQRTLDWPALAARLPAAERPVP
jgi:rhamnulokinase